MLQVYEHTTGQHLDCHEQFKTRLQKRIRFRREWSCDDSDITLAFCTITSRVGTDVEAAVKEIPVGKPAILVVCHHTFEEDYVVPNSQRFVNRQDVLLVDILFHEGEGLLMCLQNDEALKKATDCLIEYGAAENYSPPPSPRRHSRQSGRGWNWQCIGAILAVVAVGVTIILLIEYGRGDLTNGTQIPTDQPAVHGGP